ncbi:MAG: rod shape-determining protein RodA [Candidatus Cloacimonetes bacterium]|nr:rod shape-determining protein RodA [Candidatus Cloacimonadota bacterium]
MKIPITREFDWKLFISWLILVFFGFFAIFSASSIKIDDEITTVDFWWKQIVFFLISLFFMFVILKIPSTLLDIFTFPSYFIVLSCLIIVLFMPAINNAQRWLLIFGVRFQPSEFAKIVIILVNARIMSRDNISNFRLVLQPLIFMVFPFFLILQQPDLGTALVLLAVYVVMLIQAGFPLWNLFLLITPLISIITSFYIPAFIIFALLLIYFLWKKKYGVHFITLIMVINLFVLFITPVLWGSLQPYQQNRILTFIDPTRDPLNTGYQIIQAKIAIGSGQLFGKGFLEGSQKNMNFLPEHHTDFIFSVISEELGFIGSILLLVLFIYFFRRIIKNIFRSEIKERRIAMAGCLSFLFFQVFINIGMNVGIMPTTGIPLPFISYGGSNMLASSIAVALVLKYSQE